MTANWAIVGAFHRSSTDTFLVTHHHRSLNQSLTSTRGGRNSAVHLAESSNINVVGFPVLEAPQCRCHPCLFGLEIEYVILCHSPSPRANNIRSKQLTLQIEPTRCNPYSLDVFPSFDIHIPMSSWSYSRMSSIDTCFITRRNRSTGLL